MTEQTTQAPVSRVTRRWYAFGISGFSLISSFLMTYFGVQGTDLYVQSAFDLTGLVAVMYIGGSVMDKADLLGKLGAVFTRK